jgi:tetratricopeptide (TPR) repeat protein
MIAPVLLRVALVALAVLAVAWLATGLRASELESDGQAVVDKLGDNPPRAEVERGIDALRDSQRLNVDEEPVVGEILLLLDIGRRTEAKALGERLVVDEPENADSWFGLLVASLATGNRERAGQAIDQLRELDPLRGNVLERLDPYGSDGS